MYNFPMHLIVECPGGTGFFFFFLFCLYVHFSNCSYSRGLYAGFFFMYIFPMVLIVECPLGTGIFLFFFFGCIFYLWFI